MRPAWPAFLTTVIMGMGMGCGPSSPSSQALTTTDTSTSESSTQPGSTNEDAGSSNSTNPEPETETETETETSEGTSLTFVPEGDFSSFPKPCEMIAPGDCLEGDKCVPGYVQGELTNVCRPVMGEGEPSAPCEVDDDSNDTCGAESWCFQGECRAYCSGTYDEPLCADPEHVCMTSNDHVYVGCMPSCDPLLADCGEGESCILTGANPSPSTFVCIPHQEPPAGLHEPCTFINACGPALFCTGAAVPGCESPSCCAELCDISDLNGMCSAPNTSCVSLWGDMPLEGHEDVGVCISP